MASKRFHINAKGEPGECRATQGQCPFGDDSSHFATAEEARSFFESTQDAFSVVIKKNQEKGQKTVYSLDENLQAKLVAAEGEYATVEDKGRWVEDKVRVLEEAQGALDRTLPGTPERSEALIARVQAREELLAADLVTWRNSPFYNPSVEERMKETTINVTDADYSLEHALEDKTFLAETAATHGVSTRDVENILEVAHKDYLRPRSPLSSSLADLSANGSYASSTAYVFRVEPEVVAGVLSSAAQKYSTRKESTAGSDPLAFLD